MHYRTLCVCIRLARLYHGVDKCCILTVLGYHTVAVIRVGAVAGLMSLLDPTQSMVPVQLVMGGYGLNILQRVWEFACGLVEFQWLLFRSWKLFAS